MDTNNLVKLCVDAYRGNVEKYSTKQSNDVIRNAFIDVCGTDKLTHRVFEKHKNDIYEIIEDTLEQLITDGWEENTFFDQFVEVKNLALGDTNEFYVEDNSLVLVSKFSGGHWNLKRQRLNVGESFTVPTHFYGAKIYENFNRMLAGRIDWTAFVNKVSKSFTNQVKQETYTSFMGATQYLPTEFKGNGTFTKDGFLEKCEHVSASNGNAPIVIAGTKTALSKLNTQTDWISEDMKKQRNTDGMIMSYEGYKCMPIEQIHKANTFEFAVDSKKLLILPANTKPIKLVYEGDTRIKEISDGTTNMDGSLEYMFQSKMGTKVVFNVMYGSWDLE